MLNWSVIFELDFACWWQFEKCIWLVWLDEITQPGISTWDNLLHLEESKLRHNFLGIGFQLAGAHNGYGILSTQGNFSLLKCDIASTKLKSWQGRFLKLHFNCLILFYFGIFSKLVSWRTRALVVSDWTRRFIFGRDSSGIWGRFLWSHFHWLNESSFSQQRLQIYIVYFSFLD